MGRLTLLRRHCFLSCLWRQVWHFWHRVGFTILPGAATGDVGALLGRCPLLWPLPLPPPCPCDCPEPLKPSRLPHSWAEPWVPSGPCRPAPTPAPAPAVLLPGSCSSPHWPPARASYVGGGPWGAEGCRGDDTVWSLPESTCPATDP